MTSLLYIVIFFSGFGIMSFEILSSRLIEPYFGSDIFTWTNLIGTFLLALAFGYWAGGKMVDVSKREPPAGFFLLFAGLLISASPYFTSPVCIWLNSLEWQARYLSLIACLILFGPPIFALGTLTPFFFRRRVRAFEEVGLVSGRIGAVSTIGSLVGTFFTTFVLLNFDFIGVKAATLMIGFLLSICGIVLASTQRKRVVFVAVLLFVQLPLSAYFRQRPIPPLQPGADLLYESFSPYNTVRVIEEPWKKDPSKRLRRLVFRDGGGAHSAVVMDGRSNPSTSYYTNLITLGWLFRREIQSVAIIGAGGGVIPRDLLRWRPATIDPKLQVDVVDIDPKTFEAAEKFFDYPTGDPRLHSHVEDGRRFFVETQKKFDLVFLDAIAVGARVPVHLTTVEFFVSVKRTLNPGAVVIMHFPFFAPTKIANGQNRLNALIKTMAGVFGEDRVRVLARGRLPHAANQNETGGAVFALNGGTPLTENFANMSEAFPDFISDVFGNTLKDYTLAFIPQSQISEALSDGRVLTDDVNQFPYLPQAF